MHQSIGHLGIFVSGKVAKKEHTQIVSVLEAIEACPPGLYGMEITELKGADGRIEYEVSLHEHRLEEVGHRMAAEIARDETDPQRRVVSRRRGTISW